MCECVYIDNGDTCGCVYVCMVINLCTTVYMYRHIKIVYFVSVLVGRCLATKVFIGKLLATGGVWVIME